MVLGISPGTRILGVALLEEGTLYRWQSLAFAGKWSDAKKQKIVHAIRRWIHRHGVTQIAIKIPDELPVSQEYIQVVAALNVLCEQKKIIPQYFTLSELKHGYFPDRKINKQVLIAYLLKQYPDLHIHVNARVSKSSDKVYEAVGVARLTYIYSHLPD